MPPNITRAKSPIQLPDRIDHRVYKTELVHGRRIGWDSREELELATARWVAWFNRDRLHAELGYRTPIELELEYVHEQGLLRPAA